MAKICYCADDFAMNPEISEAILLLIKKGVLHATSCMTQSEHWPIAAQQLKTLTTHVEVGLHLNFTHAFQPQTIAFPLPMLMLKAWTRHLDTKIIQQSLEQQWNSFLSEMGKQPDFIDGHQHIHQFPVIRDVLMDFLQQQNFQGWIRNLQHPLTISNYTIKTRLLSALGAATLASQCRQKNIHQNQYFAGIYDFEQKNYAQLNQQWLMRAQDNLLIMCHPATQAVDQQDPIAQARVREFQYLSSSQFRDDCQIYQISLTSMDTLL
ncbi:ChbG/HpnK family deacetylase [Acinetobacter higginsii]|uniref:ChbG/HpnK family deacetylase n=1 Tax=Acinetobacter higginsii TaxID=70347 RepID=UPI001F4A3E4E|nr:ChbG/HpnK family deacetylase [Acinetobacter higginsii]MCH7341176.1 ChbG/HpnK family deacetylase [Acinetobacter higginsii]